ncbi:hypothetical protein [Streptomyces kanamyceticus]|uniref:Uncharacterized protein n=1 Tax=Streptomyces kanamyceticus TaxID=1967 RepID=A0A5J6GDN7_STRKN|nr:hypothetical protein [Streptomyces kanamyceticus]QEU93990.1 hypothetical protein CP970_26560 [Streptomyces kanamyceticus]
MCDHCDDLDRTVAMLGDLVVYANWPGADEQFVAVIGPSLAASLPTDLPPGSGPIDGPPNSGGEW